MYDQGPSPPQFKFNNLLNKHFPLLTFFQKYFVLEKLLRWIVIRSWCNRWLLVRLYTTQLNNN